MKKRCLALAAAACMLLSGCSSLLERSYSSVEPYTDRYWDSGEADTLKAESYQDLVNSMLMLIERRSEEGVIRYYISNGEDGQVQAARAKYEVCTETLMGSYYLENLVVSVTNGENYCTMTCYMTYREGVQDIDSMMALTDSQSLTDLLRMALREGHDSLTAQFISKVSREEVEQVVQQLWQELYLAELEEELNNNPTPAPEEESEEPTDEEQGETEDPTEGETSEPNEGETQEPNEGNEPDGTDEDSEYEEPDEDTPEDPVIEIPPCPWVIIFYPDTQNAQIVEIRLK